MGFLVDPTDQRSALEAAAQRPVAGFDPGFIERFKADYDSMQGFSNLNAQHRQALAAQADFQTRFFRESGQRLPGWIDSVNFNAEDQARKQFDDWKVQNPQSDLTFPSPEQFQADVENRAGAVRKRSVDLSDRSTSWSSALGGFAGSAAGAMTDPVNLLTVPFGANPAAGVVRSAVTEGGINMAAQAVVSAGSDDFRRRVDPNYSGSEAVYEILAAGAGGAAIGGGLKGIAALWRRTSTGEWPRHVRDAANVVMRDASLPASRLDRSPQGQSVYRSAIEKASDDIMRGQPVVIPESAFLQASARPGRVYDADGRSVGVTYDLAEMDSLITSHNDAMLPNEAFPQQLQPRDRTRAISQDQVQSIASNLQPERLGPSPQAESGAPIIGPDGLVESGNARVMALRRVFNEGGVNADNYRAYLRSQNFDPAGFDKPVLVARRVTDLTDEDRIRFVTAANRSTAMRLGTTEQALADARLLDDAVLSRLQGADGSALENRSFVRGFMSKLPRAEQGELVDRNGVLSQAGERRVAAALMGRAYGEPALLGRALEDADSNIRTIAGALTDAAPEWTLLRDAVARGDIPRGMDITDDLLEAVRLVTKARDEGRAVKDMVNQAEMFGGPNEIAKIVARAMFNDEDLRRGASRTKLSAFLRDYAAEAQKNDAGPRLFGDALEAPDVLRNSLARVGRQDLEAIALDRLSPKAMDELAADAKTAEASIMDAERLIADNEAQQLDAGKKTVDPVMIDLGDGRGERALDDILREADEEIAAGKEIEACTLGAAAE